MFMCGHATLRGTRRKIDTHSHRSAFDFALSAVAAAVDVGADGAVRNARLVLGEEIRHSILSLAMPDDIAVEPASVASRSSTTTSAPVS